MTETFPATERNSGQCPQCGAAVSWDAGLLSAQCASCEAALDVTEGESAEPVDFVAPFQVSREQASNALAAHLEAQWLAPDALRRAVRPDELHAVLVPFYAFDATVRSTYSCQVGCYWYRTETYTTRVNGKTVRRTRRVRETEWHHLSGTHGATWSDHLVSASVGLPEAESNALEPFDVGAAKPFEPSWVAGLIAEQLSVGHEQALVTARAELGSLAERTIAGAHLPGDTHKNLRSASDVDVDGVRLVLLPVWTAVYRADATKPMRLLVNGQTTEVVGHVPRSPWKVALLVVVGVLAVMGSALCAASCSGLGAMAGGG